MLLFPQNEILKFSFRNSYYKEASIKASSLINPYSLHIDAISVMPRNAPLFESIQTSLSSFTPITFLNLLGVNLFNLSMPFAM